MDATRDEIAHAAAEVLEVNLQFCRRDPSDKNRYFVGPEVLQALGWTATAIALPIMLCAANEVVKARVNEWLKRRKEKNEPDMVPPDALEKELAKILESKGSIVITDAVNAVTEFLSYRGWPAALAASDASQIIESIRKRVDKT
jgi:hypothetical protein